MQAYFVTNKISIDSSMQIKSGTIYIPDLNLQIIPRNGTLPMITKLNPEEFRWVCEKQYARRFIEYSKKEIAVIKKAQREQDKARRSIDAIVNRGWKEIRQAWSS